MRSILITTLIVAAVLTAVGRASAQGFGQMPYQRPVVSPYLNLNRRGADPAINYYDLVRPQIDQYAFNQQIYERTALPGIADPGVGAQGQGDEQAAPLRMPVTGRPIQVQSQRRYFQTFGTAGSLAGRPGGSAGYGPRSVGQGTMPPPVRSGMGRGAVPTLPPVGRQSGLQY